MIHIFINKVFFKYYSKR